MGPTRPALAAHATIASGLSSFTSEIGSRWTALTAAIDSPEPPKNGERKKPLMGGAIGALLLHRSSGFSAALHVALGALFVFAALRTAERAIGGPLLVPLCSTRSTWPPGGRWVPLTLARSLSAPGQWLDATRFIARPDTEDLVWAREPAIALFFTVLDAALRSAKTARPMRKIVAAVSVSLLLFAWACVGDSSTTDVVEVSDASADALTQADGTSPSADAGAADASDAGNVVTSDADAGLSVLQVEMGDETACALLSDGTVWCWGEGQYGELGTPPSTTIAAPARVAGLSDITSISVGTDFACAISKSSSLYCWGENTYGELGHDPSGDILCGTSGKCQPTPMLVAGILVKQVSVGEETTCAVTTSGTAVCFGLNNVGQIGSVPGASSFVSTPTPVPAIPSTTIIEVTNRFPGGSTCAIDSGNKLYCWGLNNEGQLGHTPGKGTDTLVGGNYIGTPSLVTTSPDGTGTNFDNVAHVHASHTTCAVRLDGTVWCWGNNTGAFLGNGTADTAIHATPTQVNGLANIADVRGGNSICALSKTGAISCWGDYQALVGNNIDAGCTTYKGSADTCTVTPSVVSTISASSFDVDHYSAIAIDKSGIPNAWGNNGAGELGHTPGTEGDDTGLMSNPTPKPVVGLP